MFIIIIQKNVVNQSNIKSVVTVKRKRIVVTVLKVKTVMIVKGKVIALALAKNLIAQVGNVL